MAERERWTLPPTSSYSDLTSHVCKVQTGVRRRGDEHVPTSTYNLQLYGTNVSSSQILFLPPGARLDQPCIPWPQARFQCLCVYGARAVQDPKGDAPRTPLPSITAAAADRKPAPKECVRHFRGRSGKLINAVLKKIRAETCPRRKN